MMYFYGCKHKDLISRKRILTDYSPLFDNEGDCLVWYRDYGVKLEKLFNRKLIASKRKY